MVYGYKPSGFQVDVKIPDFAIGLYVICRYI